MTPAFRSLVAGHLRNALLNNEITMCARGVFEYRRFPRCKLISIENQHMRGNCAEFYNSEDRFTRPALTSLHYFFLSDTLISTPGDGRFSFPETPNDTGGYADDRFRHSRRLCPRRHFSDALQHRFRAELSGSRPDYLGFGDPGEELRAGVSDSPIRIFLPSGPWNSICRVPPGRS